MSVTDVFWRDHEQHASGFFKFLIEELLLRTYKGVIMFANLAESAHMCTETPNPKDTIDLDRTKAALDYLGVVEYRLRNIVSGNSVPGVVAPARALSLTPVAAVAFLDCLTFLKKTLNKS